MGRFVQFLMVLLIVLAMLASSSAGDVVSTSQNISLPGVSGSWRVEEDYWSSDRIRASVNFRLENHEIENADWNFNYGYSPNTWSASFYAYGLLLDQESSSLVPRNQWTNVSNDDMELSTNITVNSYEDWSYVGKDQWLSEEKWFRLEATMSLEPSIVTSSSCYYREYTADWLQEPENKWSLNYYVSGEFIQTNPVPEPSTICLFGSFLAFGAVVAFRRRRRQR